MDGKTESSKNWFQNQHMVDGAGLRLVTARTMECIDIEKASDNADWVEC